MGTKSACHLAKLIIFLVLFQKCFSDDQGGRRNSTRDDSLSWRNMMEIARVTKEGRNRIKKFFFFFLAVFRVSYNAVLCSLVLYQEVRSV